MHHVAHHDAIENLDQAQNIHSALYLYIEKLIGQGQCALMMYQYGHVAPNVQFDEAYH